MKKIYYHILATPVYLIGLLPFPVFYFMCDMLYVLTYHIAGYRKKVVYTNLRKAFPEKNEAEITAIAKGFYHFLIDLTMETFKELTMSGKQLKERVQFDNMSVIDELKERKQSFVYVMGHFGNWEWSGQSFQLHDVIQLDVLYHPLSNPFFDWLVLKTRARFGMRLIPMNSSVKEMVRRKEALNATVFIADQTPSNPRDAYWLSFLNQDTPVLTGTERIAKKFNYPVVFASVRRIRRGYYRTYFTKICDEAAGTPDGFITEAHTRLLEEEIRRQPETWLWSHRRWKHKRS